ncbi:MAG: DUF255 domain-containing protein [Chitinophagaceae bacterium]
MKKLAVLVILYSPLFLTAQEKGIKWIEGLTWSEVQKKAKEENKYIFVDCFATWCGPCHVMDKEVYPNEQVGQVINDKFISVKVQIDKTSYDNEGIKKWYNDAKVIESNYSVTAFPTFLFFYPDGKPMHRAVGYRNFESFISLSKDALDPQKQYYALLRNYQPGKIDTSELKGLARALNDLGGDLAVKMAIEYLTRIPRSEFVSDDNIKLMCEFSANAEMQQFTSMYLSNVPPKYFSNTSNLTLVRSFGAVPSVRHLVLRYLANIKSSELSKHLALLTVFDEDSSAKIIADKYINGLKGREINKKENLEFIVKFTKSSKDRGFKIFRENSDRIDSVFKFKGYALIVIGNVIIKEEYTAFFNAAIKNDVDNVSWQAIWNTVYAKYGRSIAERLDIQVKSSLYGYFAEKKDKYWQEYIRYYIDKIEKNGYDTSHPQIQFIDVMQINNFVFNAIFYHSIDTQQMKTGLKWMEGVLRRNPKEANNIDTYANLLYKLGRKEDAIHWQEKAVQTAITEKMDWLLPSLQANLAKMKKDIPTWIKEL